MGKRREVKVNLADRKAVIELTKQLYGTGVQVNDRSQNQTAEARKSGAATTNREPGTTSSHKMGEAPTKTA